MTLDNELLDFLESANDWDKMKTNIPGNVVVKVPRKSQLPRLMVEVNPVFEDGRKLKRKGLYLSSLDTYLKFYEILSDTGKLNTIMRALDKINPAEKGINIKEWTLSIED